MRSALAGIAQNGEVVVVDDHSQISARYILRDIADDKLRIIALPDGIGGVSEARNAGIAHANGEIIFFLDDDDELEQDYCRHVLRLGVADHDYGFSSYVQVNDDRSLTKAGRVRFAEGPIPSSAPLRKQLCGFGMGFWIWRNVALQTGKVATNLSMNEDTEYLCRLITAGKRGWYSAQPGVVLHAHTGGPADIEHLTKRTSATERARCMRAVCDQYPQLVSHLGTGYVRHCLKTDEAADAWRFIHSQTDWRVRNRLRLFATIKMLANWLTRRSGTI